jgi:hypothetical protein
MLNRLRDRSTQVQRVGSATVHQVRAVARTSLGRDGEWVTGLTETKCETPTLRRHAEPTKRPENSTNLVPGPSDLRSL